MINELSALKGDAQNGTSSAKGTEKPKRKKNRTEKKINEDEDKKSDEESTIGDCRANETQKYTQNKNIYMNIHERRIMCVFVRSYVHTHSSVSIECAVCVPEPNIA